MGWNEPGNGKEKDPWGGRGGSNQGPPDLDEVVRKLQDKLSQLFGGRGGGGTRGSRGGGNKAGIGGLLLVVLALWLVYDMSYIIQEPERGVVLRFGQYVDTIESGLNFRLPRPIEFVQRVNVDEIRNIEIGYRSGGRQSSSVLNEALMLTQDENIVDIKLAVQYRVKDARDYLFNVNNPDMTLVQATESSIREIIGKSKMDFVITEGRAAIAESTEDLIQIILDRYQTGLQVTNVNMQDAQPPEQVQAAFNDAVKAREDEQRLINEAEAYSNDIIPKARGGAARQVEEARAYQAKVISKAEGESSRFLQVLAEYKKAPGVTRERLYLDTIESVMANSSKVMVDVEGGNNLLYLPLDKLMQRRTEALSSNNDQGIEDIVTPQRRDSEPETTSRQDFRRREGR